MQRRAWTRRTRAKSREGAPYQQAESLMAAATLRSCDRGSTPRCTCTPKRVSRGAAGQATATPARRPADLLRAGAPRCAPVPTVPGERSSATMVAARAAISPLAFGAEPLASVSCAAQKAALVVLLLNLQVAVWRDLRQELPRTAVQRPAISTNNLALPNCANHRFVTAPLAASTVSQPESEDHTCAHPVGRRIARPE